MSVNRTLATCACCGDTLSPEDDHAYRMALKAESETEDTLAVVCQTCSVLDRDDSHVDREHIHLFPDPSAG